MKRILLILGFVSCFCLSYGEKITEYVYRCGDKNAIITCTEEHNNGVFSVKMVMGAETNTYILDEKHVTVSWVYIDTVTHTDLFTTLISGGYHLNGIFNGKQCYITRKSNGLPWYQNIELNVGYSMKGRTSYKFECIRPDNLKLYSMQADLKESENSSGHNTALINVHLTGLLSRFFSTNYYINKMIGLL